MISFSVKKHTKKPKMIIHDGITFVLYTQEQTKLETCKLIVANMQLKIKLPHQIK